EGRSRDALVGVVRGARYRARARLQTRPGSQPLDPAGAPARAREPHLPAHRGANPRPPDLVPISGELNFANAVHHASGRRIRSLPITIGPAPVTPFVSALRALRVSALTDSNRRPLLIKIRWAPQALHPPGVGCQ